MKFTLASILVLSAVCIVRSQGEEENEDPSFPKEVTVTCNSQEQITKCKESIEKVLAEPGTQDKFSFVEFDGLNASPFALKADYLGTCSKAIEDVRSIPECGSQECPNVSCSFESA